MSSKADISEELITIGSEEKGEHVRDAIMSALTKVNNNPGTAQTVDGLSSDDLVFKKDVDDVFPLETELKQYSNRAATSGAIYNHLQKVGNVMDQISNETSVNADETVKDKITYLNDTKSKIRAAIIAKNVEIDQYNTTFRGYVDKIRDIPTVTEISTSEVEIAANTETDAGKNKAFSKVTVNVKPKGGTKSVSKVGTYKATDDGYEVYTDVDVNITSGLTSKTIASEDLEDSPGTPTVIRASSTKDVIGFSDISVDLSGKFAELQQEVDPENGDGIYTFDASDEGLYGYSKITLTIMEVAGPFTVEYYDGDTKLYTDPNVPKNGNSTYKGTIAMDSIKPGYVFDGWEPEPVNVTKNLKCYAKWKKDGKVKDLADKTWSEVSANGGIDVNIGDTKEIYWGTFDFYGRPFNSGHATATCIWKGETGTTSTWSMTINFSNIALSNKGLSCFPNSNGRENAPCIDKRYSYKDSVLCEFFSSTLANAIIRIPGQEGIQFKPVKKWTMICDNNGQAVETLESYNGLWLFSRQEMGASANLDVVEKNGIAYSGSHSINNGYISRSCDNISLVRDTQKSMGLTYDDEIYITCIPIASRTQERDLCFGLWWNQSAESASSFSTKHGGMVTDSAKGYLGPITVGFCL